MTGDDFVPVDIPAAWHGNELLDRDDWLFSLTTEDVDELKFAVATSAQTPLEQLTPATFPIHQLAKKLLRIQDALETGSGACLLQKLPVNEFSEEELRRLFFGLSTYVGTPVSQSANGDRIFSVRNEGYASDDPRSRGPNTKKTLSFHTDRCDVIAFLCIKQAMVGGDNHIVSSVALYNEILELHPELLSVLTQPFYYKRHNVDVGNSKPYVQQPIFSIFHGHFAANILRVLIDRAYELPELPDMTETQRASLDLVEELAKKSSVTFRQQPGDIVMLNNFVTFHSRSEFVDHAEISHRRHLLRIWLSVPNSRPLDPMFAGNYGATDAGAIRGGMPPA